MSITGKILVIKPSSLGDVVHLFPALEVLRRAFPDKELDFVIHPAFAGLLDFSPFPVRKKILFDRKKLGSLRSFPVETFKLLRELRREEYELVIDFQGLLRSALMAASVKSCIIAGFEKPKEKIAALFYSKKIPVNMEQHAVSRYVELVNKLCSTSFEVPEVKIPAGTPGIPGLPERFLVMVPGARWESKKFPPELFGKIFLEIKKSVPDCGAVIVGAACDNELAGKIRELVPEALDLTGKTSLAQLIPLMDQAEAVLTNDSGPMHIAALTGTRIFALFGPTRPYLTGPWGEKNEIITCSGLPCLECMKRVCPASSECHRIDPVLTGEKIAQYIQQKSSGVQL